MPTSNPPTTLWAGCVAMLFSASSKKPVTSLMRSRTWSRSSLSSAVCFGGGRRWHRRRRHALAPGRPELVLQQLQFARHDNIGGRGGAWSGTSQSNVRPCRIERRP